MSGRWTRKASMSVGRYNVYSCTVGGKIYVFLGSVAPGRGGAATPAVEAYDRLTDTSERKVDMTSPRTHVACCALNGKIYLFGGEEAEGAGPYVETVEAYDPATDTWQEKIRMPTKRSALAVSKCNGKLYAIGGAKGPWPFHPLSTVEEYTL